MEFQSTLSSAESIGTATLGWLLEKTQFALNHFPKTARFKNTRTLTLSKSTTKWLKMGHRKLRVFQYTVDQIVPVKTVPKKPGRPESALTLTPSSKGWLRPNQSVVYAMAIHPGHPLAASISSPRQ